MKLEKGLIHIYTGNGKGKSTAAIGQAIRSAGNSLTVFIVQFLKTDNTGELKILNNIENIKTFRFEKKHGFFWNLSNSDKIQLQKDIDTSINFISNVLENNLCDLLILDEIMSVISNRLIDLDFFIRLLKNKPKSMEVILTGRNAPEKLIAISDYVSEIKNIKHPYEKNIAARKGIEF